MENETVSKNFIENIIDKDLAEGVYDTVHTRGPAPAERQVQRQRSDRIFCQDVPQ